MTHISLGMDISGWCSEAVVGATTADGDFQVVQAWHSGAPSVCVLPRFPGERPRATWPAIRTHWARGSGFPRSTALRPLLGRVPTWLAWLGLGVDAVNPQWRHRYADESGGAVPLRSVLRAYAEALFAVEPPDPAQAVQPAPALHVIAMPEHFQERAQENLLAGLPRDRGDVRLLWHSVAVCLAWIDTLSPSRRARYAGKRVAVVDVGLAEVSATVVELRKRSEGGQTFLVPKRDLPESGSSCRWPIVPFDLCLAAELLETLGEPWALRELWQVACGGATGALVQAVPEDAREAATLVETVAGWRRLDLSPGRLGQAVAAAASRPKINGLDELWLEVRGVLPDLNLDHDGARQPLARTLEHDVADWLCGRDEPPDKILLTGPVMRLAVAPEETLGDRLVRGLRVPAGCKVLVAGRDLPPAVSAVHGCAIYGGRELAGLPTYLDTLPRFCIVGKDRLRWKDVHYDLVPHSEWEGGKEYRSDERELERLRHAAKIPSGRRRVRFRLLRQDQEKQLEQGFEQAPPRDCLLSFDVRLRPAQGFARVRILPEQTDLFGGREVVLDWEKMKEAKPPPEGPPDFPTCAPLEPNPWRIRNYAAPVLEEYVSAVSAERWARAEQRLDAVGRQLQSGGAYGSAPTGSEIQRLVRALSRHRQRCVNLKVYDNYRGGRAAQRKVALEQLKNLMRAASGLFTKTPSWARAFLEREFQHVLRKARDEVGFDEDHMDPNPKPVFLHAAGRCFSDPGQIALFVECFDPHFRRRMENWQAKKARPGMNNWCKAFQIILRLHDEAVLHFEREQADSLARSLCLLLEAEQPTDRRRLRAPYKHAVFCVYFLLRFRARPDGADFLGNWGRKGTVACGIHDNLWRHRDVGACRQATLLPDGRGETIQAALLRFLESKATAQDIVIMKEAHDAALGEADDEDGENDGDGAG